MKLKQLKTGTFQSHENAQICHSCKKNENKYLEDKKYSKVRNHCHYTGEYRGAEYSI